MSSDYAIDFVGRFWRPHKLSSRRCAKVFKWAKGIIGSCDKPTVRFFTGPDGWLYMLVYRRTA